MMIKNILVELNSTLNNLERREYLRPTIKEFNRKIGGLIKDGYSKSEAYILVFDYLTEIMRRSQKGVEEIIQNKIKMGEISDASQSRVAVAGLNFQGIITYALIQNILLDNLPNVVVAFRPKQSKYKKLLEKYTEITVGDETQKPDVDIMVFDPNNESAPIVVYSCKTSLRERAGQTYKWKLLYEMATSKCKYIEKSDDCPVKKYKIGFSGGRKVLVGFITADFYNEVSSPQLRGMLSFFDFSYVSKPNIGLKKIRNLSKIIEDLNEIFGKQNKARS